MGWELIDHACHHCAGRIVKRVNDEGELLHRCTNCGTEVVGKHSNLCWCGVEVGRYGVVFECFVNPAKSLSMPQEILIREKEQLPKPAEYRISKYDRAEEY